MQSALVSIGVPVRNGGSTLSLVLDGLVRQTYKNIEIIISDNASSDGTASICEKYAQADARIKYIRHEQFLTAAENFKYVVDCAKGEYFVWAAHDDLRSLNYVKTLLEGFNRNPDASLVFSDVAEFSKYEIELPSEPADYPFSSEKLSLDARLKKYIRFNCLHIYGLIKRQYLIDYPWFDIDYGPDIPLLLYLANRGDFVYVPGAFFYYFVPLELKEKTPEARAVANSGKKLGPFPELRVCWISAKAVQNALKFSAIYRAVLPLFFKLYIWRHWGWIKPFLYELTPHYFQQFWRHLKARAH